MTDMRLVPKTIAAIAASAALLGSSTLAAAAPAPQAQPAQAATPDAWMMLSTLSAAQSVGLAGANAAVQPTDVPPPPPPVAAGAMGDGVGELIPFVLWFGLIAIALSISGSPGGSAVITPNSAG
jgi:hypothetical protein